MHKATQCISQLAFVLPPQLLARGAFETLLKSNPSRLTRQERRLALAIFR